MNKMVKTMGIMAGMGLMAMGYYMMKTKPEMKSPYTKDSENSSVKSN